MWPFLFMSSSELAQMCENSASFPCWRPERAGRARQPFGPSPYAHTLTLWAKDGEYWVRVVNPRANGAAASDRPKQWVYRLRPAVTSWWALCFWVLAAGILLARRRHYASLARA